VQAARAIELGPYACLRRLFAVLPAEKNVADLKTLLHWNIARDEQPGCRQWTTYVIGRATGELQGQADTPG
jgi:hypothetical protein